MSLTLFYVYVLFRPWDGTPFYVGKGKGKRAYMHAKLAKGVKYHNANAQNIFKKAEALGLEVPVMMYQQNMSEKKAFALEVLLIHTIGRKVHGGTLVNLSDGGEGPSGHIKSAESIKKISDAAKLRTGAKNSFYGKTHTEEMKAQMSRNRMGRSSATKGVTGSAHHWWGRKHTEEHKERMRQIMLGRIISEETREKLRNADCGKSTRGTTWWTRTDGSTYRSVEMQEIGDTRGRRVCL